MRPVRQPTSNLARLGMNEDYFLFNHFKLGGVLKASLDLELIMKFSALFIFLLLKRANVFELSEVNNE